MGMYALAITPLIHNPSTEIQLPKCPTGMVCRQGLLPAQTSNHGGASSSSSPAFGYYPNASKTHLVVKQEHESNAREQFSDINVQITIQGKRHLRAAIGSRTFTEYVCNKGKTWMDEIKRLAKVATSKPQAAYAAFTHSLMD